MDTLRNPAGPLSAGTYWRRRIIVVAVLLVVVVGVVWACTRNSDAQQKPMSAASSSSPAGLPTVPEETTSPTASSSTAPSGSAGSGTPSATDSGSKSPSPTLSEKNGKPICPADDVRVSVRTAKKFYSPDEKPKFTVIIVNLRKSTCYIDMGKASASITVISGKDRVWSNADCSDRKDESLRKFRSGDVYTSNVTWQRNRSAEGCEATDRKAKPGYYVVDAKVGKSKPKERPVFVLEEK